jgi:hypothetical protein
MSFKLLRHLCLSGVLLGVTALPILSKEAAFVKESIRARGMGNAFTAAANDESVLFYNPAGLRSVSYNIFELVSVSATTNVKNSQIPFEASLNTDDIAVDNLGSITGKNIHAEVDLSTLSFVNSRFGWTVFGNTFFDFEIHNPVLPYFDVDAYVQYGGAFGVAWSFADYQLDVGLGGKLISRSGTRSTFRLTDPAITEAIDGDSEKLQDQFVEDKSSAAFDLGTTYHYEGIHNFPMKLALSFQNITGLDFEAAGEVPMTMNVGFASESELQGFDFILATDYRDLTNAQKLAPEGSTFTQRNLKMGAEIGWEKLNNGHHLLSFRLGRNGSYNTWGFSLNLWKLRLDFAQFSEEVGGYAGEKEDKRWAFQAGLIF